MSAKQRLLIVLGFLLLLVGAVGIFFPVLPTTPFVLLAAACFAGNPKWTAWLHRSRLFSDYITNYRERTGLKKRTIAISLVFLWGMLAVSMVCIRAGWATLLLLCVGIAVSVHILYMSLPKKNPPPK